ncbi:YihY/virulence factor BrkB family protein [Catenulispora sp. NF23]|uniref:YihY/virulence factor BrkB family protein n=1 Tax=Catenulispora pinistramenti TaxID=2705254 RepID=A0ABS5KN83_9ACTN|nr:YhjD/YihY/BrkB family envelope integrity protein [Catenulispora pinistramenti]MBS2532841.1 YihY/virulence factor BrkB family protein [Catenulispora pinistramenti]MBS2547518.1 YihY/virulence factor BrkB family protein [Catenulispora pinistramenti]
MDGESAYELPTGRYARWRERWSRSVLGNVWRGGTQLELLRRSMAFATLGLVALAPLLVVVAAVSPSSQKGLGQWVVDGMGLPPNTAVPVLRLFAAHHREVGQIGILGLALLAAFGLAFVTDVQLSYQRIWEIPPESWRQAWRRAVWLAALIGYLAFEVESGALLRHGPVEQAMRIIVFVTAALSFFWWGQYFLLAGRVPWGWLLPGALATVAGLSGLRAFSALVFKPMIASSAKDYGMVGVVLVVLSWLIGVGFVIFGGALAGRYYCERVINRRAVG